MFVWEPLIHLFRVQMMSHKDFGDFDLRLAHTKPALSCWERISSLCLVGVSNAVGAVRAVGAHQRLLGSQSDHLP